MVTGIERIDADRGMGIVRGRDEDGVDQIRFQKIAMIEEVAVSREFLKLGFHHIADGDKFEAGDFVGPEPRHVPVAHVSHPNQAKADSFKSVFHTVMDCFLLKIRRL